MVEFCVWLLKYPPTPAPLFLMASTSQLQPHQLPCCRAWAATSAWPIIWGHLEKYLCVLPHPPHPSCLPSSEGRYSLTTFSMNESYMLQNLLQRDCTWCGFCIQLHSSGCMGQLLCALVCPLPSNPPPNPCAITTHSMLLDGQSFPGVDNYDYSQGVVRPICLWPQAQSKHGTSFHPAGLSCPSISTFLENLWLMST